MTQWILSPGANLRFVERYGMRILQQVWIKGCWVSGQFNSGTEYEWRDVPLTSEDAPELPWSESGYT